MKFITVIVDSEGEPIQDVIVTSIIDGDTTTDISNVTGFVEFGNTYWGEEMNGKKVLLKLSKGSNTSNNEHELIDCQECNACKTSVPDTIIFK